MRSYATSNEVPNEIHRHYPWANQHSKGLPIGRASDLFHARCSPDSSHPRNHIQSGYLCTEPLLIGMPVSAIIEVKRKHVRYRDRLQGQGYIKMRQGRRCGNSYGQHCLPVTFQPTDIDGELNNDRYPVEGRSSKIASCGTC
jgi:hypothetical protein